jgi:ferrous iron transport protein B
MKTFALVGNPNCGKTSLFNVLTSNNERVGNWSGVTVDKKFGVAKLADKSICIVDLPGVVSLSSCSLDEIVTRDYVLYNHVDLIINVLDSTKLERGLYLTTQLLETGKDVLVVLNMYDVMKKNGYHVDVDLMSDLLGIEIIKTSSMLSSSTDKLKKFLFEYKVKEKKTSTSILINTDEYIYSQEIIKYMNSINKHCSMFEAMKILESDSNFTKHIPNDLLDLLHIDNKKQWDVLIATDRYKFVDELLKKCITHDNKNVRINNPTDKIDKILLNKYLSMPIFFLLMLIIFLISFNTVGNYFSELIKKFIENNLITYLQTNLASFGTNYLVIDLITNGIIRGIGMIVSFLPQIFILFIFLCFIEDTGYISRIAFIMDRPMKKIGLSGKSFVSIIMGLGCTVPAIMSTRIIENKRDRQLTIFLLPFISCSARVPSYIIITEIFFPKHQALIIFSLYLISTSIAIVFGFVLNKIFIPEEASIFLLELPNYRFPNIKDLLRHVVDCLKDFLAQTSTVLPIMSVIIWIMQKFDFKFKLISNNIDDSMLSCIGKMILPIFSPIGIRDWRLCVSLLTGFIAKEMIASSISVLYGLNNLSYLLKTSFNNSLAAYCYMVFVMLYAPCITAILVIKKELASYKLTLYAIVFQLLVAWAITYLLYQTIMFII